MKKIFLSAVLILIVQTFYAQKKDILSMPEQVENERSFDVINYSINMSVDLDNKRFVASNKVTLKPFLGGFSSFSLHAEELKITAVKNSDGSDLDFRQDEGFVHINMGRSYNSDETITVKLYYIGENLSDGLFFHDATDRYPKMIESNSWPNHARIWYPCYDEPNEKATQEISVTCVKPLKVVSNGALESVKEHGDSITYVWKQDKPHSSYLSMLSVAPFSVLKDSLNDLPVNYWIFPGDEENAARIFDGTPEIIDFYNRIYGYEYPWDKYDQVIGPRQGGGAEATSATILGLGVIHDLDIDKDLNWKRIIAHEIAHQWWGNLITLRTWSETWMNEGFGTYSDYLYTEAFRDKTEAELDLEGKKNAYFREARNRYIRPIVFTRYNEPQDNFDSHTYPKAAIVLHMLRAQLGDEAFFKTLSHFLHKHAFGSVETNDFKVSIKEATGRNMDWFIDQWIYNPGHPVLDVSKSWDEGQGILKFNIDQVQDKKQGIPVFKFPLKVAIYTQEGKKIYKELWIENKESQFAWRLEEKPLMVRFDVGNYLLKEWAFKKDADELIFQVKNDDVTGATWAIRQLVEYFGSTEVVKEFLQSTILDHKNWAVRLESLKALNEISYLKQKTLKSARKDEHYKVRQLAEKLISSK
ncbi:MAG: M1 family metallopeptidase [Bacteroidales bacterium]|nr:M1 family metallopeptidase [Bacteroidales bacterium]